MFYKRIVVSVVVLLVCIYIAFRIIEETNNRVPCDNACVRFCCESEETCNFNIKNLEKAAVVDPNYKPIFGKECKKSLVIFKNWNFLKVKKKLF